MALGLDAWIVGGALYTLGVGSLVADVTAVAGLAVTTRRVHLDGLADGRDSGCPGTAALEVMRRFDAHAAL